MMAACLLASALLAAAADRPPLFTARTDTVRVDVVVSRKGAALEGLKAEDFDVIDAGVRRHVEMASRVEESVHAVLVLDVSGSVEGPPLERLKEAARALLANLEPRDRVSLVTFSDRLRRVVGPVEPSAAADALAPLAVEGGTALFDGVFAGLLLARTAPGRPFVLVFTDGSDQLSWLQHDDVLAAARAAEASVYVVTTARLSGEPLPGVDLSRWEQGELRSARFLTRIADDTGGRVWSATGGVRDAFLEVLAEVKNRYLLTFERGAGMRPGWHELKVRLKNGKGDVRARKGYFVRDGDGGTP